MKQCQLNFLLFFQKLNAEITDNPHTTSQKCNAGLALASLTFNMKEHARPFILDQVGKWKMNEIATGRIRGKYEHGRKRAEKGRKRKAEARAKKTAAQAQFRASTKGRIKANLAAKMASYVNSSKSADQNVKKILKELQ